MRAALVAEYRKLVTTRLWWVLLIVLAAYLAFMGGVLAASIVFAPDAEFGIVLQPDLMYLAPERLERATRANLQGAPNLVAEVLSPGTAMLDLTRKKSLYATYGVDEYWIVRPAERRVDVLHRTGDHFGQATTLTVGETLRCALLPGFELDLTTLFANAEDFE